MKKPKDIKELNAYAFELKCGQYSFAPEHIVPKTILKDNNANNLTKCIIKDFEIRGGVAYRINVVGIYDEYRGQWRKSGMRKGLPDVIGIIEGRIYGVEVKIGKDRQSKDQKEVAQEFADAGAVYLIAKNYNDYAEEMNNIL